MKKLCLIIALIFLSGCAVTDRLMYGTTIDPLTHFKEMPKLPEDATAIVTTPLECRRVIDRRQHAYYIECFCSLAYAFEPKKNTKQPFRWSFDVLKTAFGKSLKKHHLTSLITDIGSYFGRKNIKESLASTKLYSSPRPNIANVVGSFMVPGAYAVDYYWKLRGLVSVTKGTHFYKFDRVVMFYSGRLMKWLPSTGGCSRFFYIIPENHEAILIIPITSKTAKMLHPANGIFHHPSMPGIHKLDTEIRIVALDVKFKKKCCPQWRDYCMKDLTEFIQCAQRVGPMRISKCKWDPICTEFLEHCNKTKQIIIETLWTYKQREKNLLWLQAIQGPLLEGSPW